jgi:hypothetical protein
MLQRDGVVMVEMKVLVMVVMMMIPMKFDVMAMISPPGRNFSGRFLPAGELFSLWCFLPRRGSEVYL